MVSPKTLPPVIRGETPGHLYMGIDDQPRREIEKGEGRGEEGSRVLPGGKKTSGCTHCKRGQRGRIRMTEADREGALAKRKKRGVHRTQQGEPFVMPQHRYDRIGQEKVSSRKVRRKRTRRAWGSRDALQGREKKGERNLQEGGQGNLLPQI